MTARQNLDFWLPNVLAAGGTALVVAVTLLLARPPRRDIDPHRYWRFEICTDSAWSFSDSWATNITGIGAILGIVAGSTGVLGTQLSKAASNTVAELAILFGGAAALGPLLYATFASKEENGASVVGTFGGLLAACASTVFSVLGELSTVAAIVYVAKGSTLGRSLIIAALVFAGLVVAIYAVRSVKGLVEHGRKGSLLNKPGAASATI